MIKKAIVIILGLVLVLSFLVPVISTNVDIQEPEEGTQETCEQYVVRRLSEGWEIISQEGFLVILQSPEGITRSVDLRNDVETLRPNAAGDYENISDSTPSGAGYHWQNVDEAVADGDTSMVYTMASNQLKDAYNLAPSSIPSGFGINSVKVYFCCWGRDDVSLYEQPFLRLGTNEATGTEVTKATEGWETFSEVLSRPGGGSWAIADLANLQVAIGLRASDTGYYAILTQVYVEVDYSPRPPTVISSAATNVEETTATWNGEITSSGGISVDYRGFVWGTTSKADPGNVAPASSGYDSQWYQSGTYGIGTYTYNVPSLDAGTTYYYRACAYNSLGWDYSNTQQTVYTKPENPTSLSATVISSTQIDLSWTKGVGSEKTMVRRKRNSYPTGTSDGDQVYFDTGISVQDPSVSGGHSYFYRAWAWDTNSGYSDGYSEDFGTTPLGGLYLKLWYQPNTMVLGTSLPDRSGGGHTGTIAWGTNPSGVEVSIGGLTPYSSYIAPGTEEGEIPDVLPPPGGIDMAPTVGATGEGLPLYVNFQRAAEALDWTVPNTYAVMFMIVAIVVGVAGLVAAGSVWGWVVGFGGTAALFGAVQDVGGYNIMPLWLTIVCVAFAIFTGYVWRYT